MKMLVRPLDVPNKLILLFDILKIDLRLYDMNIDFSEKNLIKL